MERYRSAAHFIERQYTLAKALGGTDYFDADATLFDQPCLSLDKDRNRRLKINHASYTGSLIEERATHSKLKARDLFQADFIIFLRPFFPNPGHIRQWYPRCACFLARGGTLELFSKATTQSGFNAMKDLFQVTTRHQLAQILESIGTSAALDQSCVGSRILRVTYKTVLNIAAIAQSR